MYLVLKAVVLLRDYLSLLDSLQQYNLRTLYDVIIVVRILGEYFLYLTEICCRFVDCSKLCAHHADAQPIHEAAIGKIAGDQILKLRTFGLTEQEAEAKIIEGFLCETI